MTFSKFWLGLSNPWCPRNAPDWINHSVIGLLTQRWSLARSNWSHSKSSSFNICTNCPEHLNDPLQSFLHMSFPFIKALYEYFLWYILIAKDWILTGQEQACSRITWLVWCSPPCQKCTGKWLLTAPQWSHLEMKRSCRRDNTSLRKRDKNITSSQSFALATLGLGTLKISEHFSEPFCNCSDVFRQRKSEDCFNALIVGNLIFRARSNIRKRKLFHVQISIGQTCVMSHELSLNK